MTKHGPRIAIAHAYRFSMEPMDAAFREGWPEARPFRLLDEALYADAGADGTLPADIVPRLASLFGHCKLSGARGIVFTGSTFGPAVEAARGCVDIPVLKADEALVEAAVARGGRILILATARRSIPVLRRNIESEAAATKARIAVDDHWVAGAQAANNEGRAAEHDRAIAEAAAAAAGYDTIVLGQMSMTPAVPLMPPEIAARTLTSPTTAVARMRQLLQA